MYVPSYSASFTASKTAGITCHDQVELRHNYYIVSFSSFMCMHAQAMNGSIDGSGCRQKFVDRNCGP